MGHLVALLAKLLKERHCGIMQQAARLIFCLMAGKEEDDWIRSKILREDGEHAARALANLAQCEPNRVAIAKEAGAIPGLVKLLAKQNNGDARSQAARALWNLACSEEIWITSKIGNEEGAIVGLVECLSVEDKPDLQEAAAGALADLSFGHEPNKVAIGNEAGAIPGLVKLLAKQNNGDTRSEAARALWNLACSEQIWIKSKIGNEEGAIAGLVECLSVEDDPSELQENAAGALGELSFGHKPNRLAIANEAGAIVGLVKCLSVEDEPDLRKYAAEALKTLGVPPVKERKTFKLFKLK